MVNLHDRSHQKELLDQDNIPFADIKQNMQELNQVNTLLGGHSITIEGFKTLIHPSQNRTPIVVCEIGCGGGDNLKAIADYCIKKNIATKFIGIDLKKECVDFAKEQYPLLDARWIASDYIHTDFENKLPDIIFSSLFCHHFTDEQLITQLQWMKDNSRLGFFINDLHRNTLAYYSIKWITGLFSRSYLVKNDAPLSVARGFRKKDWSRLLKKSHLNSTQIQWKWAFRYLLTFKHG
jgi:2-polyprenyl-3-methyl-5-hydroxy-6-metoxy-1,4-benzoquinol methylase